MATQSINANVTGGKATGGPPLGPALGPLGVNTLSVVNKINDLTKDYAGMKVPVKIIVDTETKSFEIEIGIPTTSALIAKEAQIEKGSQTPGQEFVGDINIDQAIKIAEILKNKIRSNDVRSALSQVIGTCVSMGIKIDSQNPKEVSKLLISGSYNDKLGEIKN